MENKIGLKRVITDKFYTNPYTVNLCLDNFNNYITINDNDIIIEPSAGNGEFSDKIKLKYKKNDAKNLIFAYDINPDENKKYIIKTDFLNVKNFENNEKIIVIGNPPFGRQSSIAKKFIKKCCIFSDIIAFILPKSFNKESYQKSFPLNFHLVNSIELPYNSFYIPNINIPHNVPCIFQIWKKENFNRKISNEIIPTYYSYVKKNDDPSISFRRVGVYAGDIDKNFKNKNEQSHYFIKLNDNINVDDFINKFNVIKNDLIKNGSNTVGPKSISKKELNSFLIKLY